MNMHVEAERFRKTLESSGDFLEPAEICVSIIQSRWGEEDDLIFGQAIKSLTKEAKAEVEKSI